MEILACLPAWFLCMRTSSLFQLEIVNRFVAMEEHGIQLVSIILGSCGGPDSFSFGPIAEATSLRAVYLCV